MSNQDKLLNNSVAKSSASNIGRLRFKPSALGWVFILMTLMGWVMSVNYNNNLLYMVVFILLSLMLVSLIFGWLNLYKIRLVGVKTQSAFKGEKLHTQLHIANDHFSKSEAVFITSLAANNNVNGELSCLSPGTIGQLNIDPIAMARGLQVIQPLHISSMYPIGLFVFYRPVLVPIEEWVFPEASGELSLDDYLDKHSNQSGIEADEMKTLRPYQPSDSPSHINWKAYARSDELMTSEYDGGVSVPSVILDEELLKDIPLEPRLCQLSKWVVEAENLGGEYGLKLGTEMIAANKGAEHQKQCLIALAKYQNSSVSHASITANKARFMRWLKMDLRLGSVQEAKQ